MAAAFGGNVLVERYWEILNPKPQETEEAIKERIRKKLREA